MSEPQAISDQITKAMKTRKKSTADLASILGVSQRQVQNLRKKGSWSARQLQIISKALDWQILIDPYGRTEIPLTMVNENAAGYTEHLSFSINLRKETARDLPGLVKEIEDVINRRIDKKDSE